MLHGLPAIGYFLLRALCYVRDLEEIGMFSRVRIPEFLSPARDASADGRLPALVEVPGNGRRFSSMSYGKSDRGMGAYGAFEQQPFLQLCTRFSANDLSRPELPAGFPRSASLYSEIQRF